MPGVNYAINSCSFSGATPGKHWRENIVPIITQDRVIDDNLKRQIKNRNLHTCRLLLLTWRFQYISNWPKAFTHPLSSIYIVREINSHFFHGKQFFSWLGRFTYKLSWHFLIYQSWLTSNFESTYRKPPFMKAVIFSDVILVSNYTVAKERK